ncbi:MAG: hypothetical protein LC540_16245 [Candidatus Thiodiazotropha sp.]|nr:hypothetical protein [Candidatus Thiodiazotropha sp.]
MEIHSALMPSEQHVWSYVFSELNTYWLHVVIGIKNQEGLYDYRAYFLTEIDDLVTLTKRPGTTIYEVGLVSPSYMNGTDNWQMDLLEAIAEGREPDTEYPEHYYVFELRDGKQYTYPADGNTSTLKDLKTVYNYRYSNSVKDDN